MVYYRKYRPQSLDDLIGQPQIKQTLSKAVQSGDFAHAYLFCGPRGTGKTSTARILAKMVNCTEKGDNIPCNKCASCISITDGSNLDLFEIDAASNRGIDDIRSLRETIKLAPTQSKRKIYIIDEVHMLTTEAFNALLKTLEEPPAHVLFILATTESHKIPATILSRVQRLDFHLASIKDLVVGLEKIASAERLEVDKEALELIAKKGEGSFRDSQKLLNQVASTGEKITVELVDSLLKSGSFEECLRLLELIADKKEKEAIDLINKQVTDGVNIKEYTNGLIDLLRVLLFAKTGNLEGGTLRNEQIKKLSEKFELEKLLKVLNLFIESLEKLKYVSISSLPLEIAVLEAGMSSELRIQSAELKGGQVIDQETKELTINLQEKINKLEQKLNNLQNAQSIPTVISSTQQSVNRVKNEESNNIQTPIVIDQNMENELIKDSEDKEKLLDKWNYILETIRPYNFSLEALLKQAKILNVESNIVCLEVPYSFHQRILESPKSRDLLESVLTDVLGKPSKVSCVLGKRPIRVEEIANVEVAADDEVIKLAAEIFNS